MVFPVSIHGGGVGHPGAVSGGFSVYKSLHHGLWSSDYGIMHPKRAFKLINCATSARASQILSPSSRRLTAAATDAPAVLQEKHQGHSALLHGLGDVGMVPAHLMPLILRIAHIESMTQETADDTLTEEHAEGVIQDTALGVLAWKISLEHGLVPDSAALKYLSHTEGVSCLRGREEHCQWPMEPLRAALIKDLSVLGISSLAAKYPMIQDTLLRGILETVLEYVKRTRGYTEQEEERETDEHGHVYENAEEIGKKQEEQQKKYRNPNMTPEMIVAAQKVKEEEERKKKKQDDVLVTFLDQEDRMQLTVQEQWAKALVRRLVERWKKPIDAMNKAGKAFQGFESLLGSGEFSLDGNVWNRKGWQKMDELREKLENIKELRDLVRSLGRGGGWGPLRRAPTQHLDMNARMGLLRTTLEAQETRGLTRSDDISRLLPSEAATLARGIKIPASKLIFYAKLVEKSLQTYERDGWGEFPTQIDIDRREIRPTADRGPILLCVDTSGSMRGPREVVAKALTLECMRAAKIQERGCYVFAFAGVREVRELELNMDAKSIENILEFLEKTFNGGSNFNAPIQMCLERLTQAQWANSDILLVSDGELRQPEHEIMRKLSGAKDKLGLRVHGLILGSPEQKRADPAVLRSLCTNIIPNSGKTELLIHEFESWKSVTSDSSLAFDWDDIAGNTARREAGLQLEKLRQAEIKRRRNSKSKNGATRPSVLTRMPTKNTTSFE